MRSGKQKQLTHNQLPKSVCCNSYHSKHKKTVKVKTCNSHICDTLLENLVADLYAFGYHLNADIYWPVGKGQGTALVGREWRTFNGVYNKFKTHKHTNYAQNMLDTVVSNFKDIYKAAIGTPQHVPDGRQQSPDGPGGAQLADRIKSFTKQVNEAVTKYKKAGCQGLNNSKLIELRDIQNKSMY